MDSARPLVIRSCSMGRRWVLGILAAAFLVAGCGVDEHNAFPEPGLTGVSGTWTGVTTSSGGAGTLSIEMTLAQRFTDVTGTFACSPGSGTCPQATGFISGTASTNTATLAIVFPDTNSCAFSATFSDEDDTLSGNYQCIDPGGGDSGTWSAARQ